jgi:hypothetical protein
VKPAIEKTPGCPRHADHFSRACIDVRCQKHWTPEGAPSPEEQLRLWADGKAVCPNTNHECTPDFGCCRPALLWPEEKRKAFVAASQDEREKMLLGSLGALTASVGVKAHVTRGDPKDRE